MSAVLAECPVDGDSRVGLAVDLPDGTPVREPRSVTRKPTPPSADFPAAADYSASPDGIEALVVRLGELMLIERGRVTLELFDGSAEARR